MNTKIKLIGITLIVVMALVTLGTGLAFAQQGTPTPWPGGRIGGRGMMGGGGMMGGYGMMGGNTSWMQAMHEWMTTSGGMHTLVWDSLAKTLGLTTDELYAELNSGDLTLSRSKLSYQPRFSLAEGLKLTLVRDPRFRKDATRPLPPPPES